MLKIKNKADHIKKAYVGANNKAALRNLNSFIIKAFRIDLTPKPLIEITLGRIDEKGIEDGPVEQFCLQPDIAQKLMDTKKFQIFADHLEDITIASRGYPDRRDICPIDVEKGV